MVSSNTEVSVSDHGYVGDGVADDLGAIQEAFNVADGRTVTFPPGTTARLSGTLTAHDMPLVVEATGVKFIKSAHATQHDTVNIYPGWSDVMTVSSIVPVDINVPSGFTGGYEVTVPSSPSWSPGDIVRIVADDEIPDSISYGVPPVEAKTHCPRVGQFLTVSSISGNVVTLVGRLYDKFTTNIRIGKLKQHKVRWSGGSFTTEDKGGITFMVSAAYRPKFSEIDVIKCEMAAFSIVGSFAPVVEDCYVGWSVNSVTTGQNGYGVDLSQSEDARVLGLRCKQTRHAVDGGGQRQIRVGGTALHLYGRTMNANVIDVISDSSTSSAYSMHSGAVNVTFDNCVALNGPDLYGFGLRGLYHTIRNCYVSDIQKAVVMFDVEVGDSWGITIDGLTTNNVERVFDAFVGTRPTNENMYNVRRAETSTIRNVIARNMRSNAKIFALSHGTYVLENIAVELRGTVPSDELVYVRNSSVQGSNWSINYARTTGGSGPFMGITTDFNSVIELNDIDVVRNGTRMTKFFKNPPGAFFRCSDIRLDQVPTERFSDGHNVSGFHDWEAKDQGKDNSGFASHTGLTWNSDISYSRRDQVVATFNVPGGGILEQLPPPSRLGQLLTIINLAPVGNDITVPNGTAFRTGLISNANTKLGVRGTMQLIAVESGLWRQVR